MTDPVGYCRTCRWAEDRGETVDLALPGLREAPLLSCTHPEREGQEPRAAVIGGCWTEWEKGEPARHERPTNEEGER